MVAEALKQQINFLQEIEKLKIVLRANKTLDGRNENSAEHSWHIAMMALLFEDYANSSIDMLKVIKMLLIHDIVEIDAGDTWLFEPNQTGRFEKEAKGAERLFSLLPDAQGREFFDLWLEFENRSSEEAKFAAVVDGIQPMLNHVMTGDPAEGVISVEKVLDKKRYIEAFAPNLWKLVEALIEESKKLGLYV